LTGFSAILIHCERRAHLTDPELDRRVKWAVDKWHFVHTIESFHFIQSGDMISFVNE
jgi:hypothetical protein